MTPIDDFDLLEQRVQDMVRQHVLPPEVTRVGVSFGELRDGDPAMWIDLHVTDSPALDRPDGQAWGQVMLTLVRGARQVVVDRTPSVRIVVDPARAR